MEDPVLWFAELCGDRVPNNTQAIVRFLQDHPKNTSIFEKFAQNTVFLGQLFIQRAESKERRELLRRRMETFIEWLIDLDVRPYHDEVRVYVPRKQDSAARDLREIYDLTSAYYGIEASDDTMDLELTNLRNMNVGYLFTLSMKTHKIGNTETFSNSIFAMLFRPYTQIDRMTDADRAGAVEYLRGTISNILKNRDYHDEEMHRKLLEALKQLNGTAASEMPLRYALLASCVAVFTAVVMFFGFTRIRLWLVAACSTSVHWTHLRVTGLIRPDDERDEMLKRMTAERRQHETKADRMQRELQSATDKKKSLEQQLRSLQERRDSLTAQMDTVKEQAVLRERELNAAVDRAMTVADVHAQEKHQLQSEHALARAEAQCREYELTENLREQCLVSQSLNEDVEEMKRLILAMTEANDALIAAIQPTNAALEEAGPSENDEPTTSHGATPSDVPLDPVAANPVTPSRDEPALDEFFTDVYATLFSRPHGYDSIPWFLRDLRNDSGVDGERMARSFGYATFEALLQSEEMAPRVLVTSNAEGARLYKVYPAKADLENYVTQRLGTDYGDTKRSLAFHREENSRLRSQLAATLKRMEILKTEALKPKVRPDSSQLRSAGSSFGSASRHTVAVSSERFRKVNANDANAASTSHSVLDDSRVLVSDDSTAPLSVRTRMDDLERIVQCGICMDRPKDTAFACGHTYCERCATDLKQCTFGCKKTNGKPLKFKYRIFL